MGKSAKKFVPPLKSSKNLKSDENEHPVNKSHKAKEGRKKLVINFNYAKMKDKRIDKQKVKDSNNNLEEAGVADYQRNKDYEEQSHSMKSCENADTDEEFMWFEPMQANQKSDVSGSCEGGRSESSQQGNGVESVHVPDDIKSSHDVYLFPSSPNNDKEPPCVVCHLEKKEEKKEKRKIRKDVKKTRKPPAGQIKKSVKRQVLKNLFKMGQDMAMLREKEKALQSHESGHEFLL